MLLLILIKLQEDLPGVFLITLEVTLGSYPTAVTYPV
jgi:hypothetical protein